MALCQGAFPSGWLVECDLNSACPPVTGSQGDSLLLLPVVVQCHYVADPSTAKALYRSSPFLQAELDYAITSAAFLKGFEFGINTVRIEFSSQNGNECPSILSVEIAWVQHFVCTCIDSDGT